MKEKKCGKKYTNLLQHMNDIELKKVIKILYTNWQGKTAVRKVIPKEIIFTSTKWHLEVQWLLVAFDVDKQSERLFACKDIKSWNVE